MPRPFSSVMVTIRAGTRFLQLLQLSSETTFNCSVAASNGIGQGNFSPVAQGTTPARPSKWEGLVGVVDSMPHPFSS